jgi:hypothetical protein
MTNKFVLVISMPQKGANTVGKWVNSSVWSNSHHLVEAVASGHYGTATATKRIRQQHRTIKLTVIDTPALLTVLASR